MFEDESSPYDELEVKLLAAQIFIIQEAKVAQKEILDFVSTISEELERVIILCLEEPGYSRKNHRAFYDFIQRLRQYRRLMRDFFKEMERTVSESVDETIEDKELSVLFQITLKEHILFHVRNVDKSIWKLQERCQILVRILNKNR